MAIKDEIKWFKGQFASEIAPALSGTPISLDLVCAIAFQESGELWSKTRRHLPRDEILRLAVGDTLDAPNRSAFPRNKDALIAAPDGQRMFDLAHRLLGEMAGATGIEAYQSLAMRPQKFVHGYGLFQYDLQFFRREPNFFLEQRWASLDACLEKLMKELRGAVDQLGFAGKTSLTDPQSAFVAIVYNTGFGNFKESRGLQQGHHDGAHFYGENIDRYLQIARSISTPTPAPALTMAAASQAMMTAAMLPRIVEIADNEFQTFHGVDEGDDPLRSRIADYYEAGGDSRDLDPTRDENAWSAAFISFCVKQSGATADQFSFNLSHSVYVRAAIANGDANRGVFRGHRIVDYAPKLGDIIHHNRSGGTLSFNFVKAHTGYPSHAAIVVDFDVRNGVRHAITVGGNEHLASGTGTVGKKVFPLRADGTLNQAAIGPKLICVIENLLAAGAGATSTPPGLTDAAMAAAGQVETVDDRGSADDPASPADGEISETADFDTARMLANLGAFGVAEPANEAAAAFAAASATLSLDIARAQAFLEACRNSTPRVRYGLGAKVPFLGAKPGRDFTKVDCSGFVREAIRLSTTPRASFPDGSVVQHDWVRAHGFERTTVAAALANDDAVRIAFLRPQDSAHGIGHVVLIFNGRTLESHGGVGPDARAWDGTDWQPKAFVYLLVRDGRLAIQRAGESDPAAAAEEVGMGQVAAAAAFTVHHGRRYRATVTLSGFFEKFAGNDAVADRFRGFGFTDVVITGSGSTRQAEGTWNGPDTSAQLDRRLSHVVELPAAAADAPFAGDEAVAAPAVISAEPRSGMGNISANVFSTESLPTHHDDLLIVKVHPDTQGIGPAMAMAGMNAAPTTMGLGALAFYERAGLVKRVVPLRGQDERSAPAPRLSAAAALMHEAAPVRAASADAGISFIQLQRGSDSRKLHEALATDPNVASVSRVPARYLAGRAPTKRRPARGGATIAAAPPEVPIQWNLKQVLWAEARGQASFADAEEVHVAVLDTGVDDQHEDLRVDAYHWQQPDLFRPVSNKDIIGHGTHVSGTIAALINSGGPINGICKCRLSVWKIFDDEPTYAPGLGAFVYFVNPIMYRRALAACVDEPVDVINLSIGGPAAPDATEQMLFDQLLAAGTTVIAAMGNERQSGSPTSYPAAIPGVIAVGATGIDDRVALFSNSGNHIAVAAPGRAIWSTLPTYPGQTGFAAVFGTDGRPKQGKPMRREVRYDAWDGTSMAAPHVTGCAALLIAKHKAAGNQVTPAQVREALMASADKIEAMSGADFSADYGAGRVNLSTLLL